MRFSKWGWPEWLLALLAAGAIAMVVVSIVGTAQVQSTCQRTDDTRLATRIMPSGKTVIPYTVTETRYVCPDGGEVWL